MWHEPDNSEGAGDPAPPGTGRRAHDVGIGQAAAPVTRGLPSVRAAVGVALRGPVAADCAVPSATRIRRCPAPCRRDRSTLHSAPSFRASPGLAVRFGPQPARRSHRGVGASSRAPIRSRWGQRDPCGFPVRARADGQPRDPAAARAGSHGTGAPVTDISANSCHTIGKRAVIRPAWCACRTASGRRSWKRGLVRACVARR